MLMPALASSLSIHSMKRFSTCAEVDTVRLRKPPCRTAWSSDHALASQTCYDPLVRERRSNLPYGCAADTKRSAQRGLWRKRRPVRHFRDQIQRVVEREFENGVCLHPNDCAPPIIHPTGAVEPTGSASLYIKDRRRQSGQLTDEAEYLAGAETEPAM